MAYGLKTTVKTIPTFYNTTVATAPPLNQNSITAVDLNARLIDDNEIKIALETHSWAL